MTGPAAAIVGIYEYPKRIIDDKSIAQIKAHCAIQALSDAGLTWSDVDGLYETGDAVWGNPGSGAEACLHAWI